MSSPSPAPGRRVATRSRRLDAGAVLAVLLVLLATALVLLGPRAAGTRAGEDDQAAAAGSSRIDRLLSACLTQTGGGPAEVFTLAPAVGNLGSEGSVEVGSKTAAPEQRGVLQQLARGRRSEALVVDARGQTAAGRVTFQVQRAPGTLAVTECVSPRADWWFVGGGADLDHTSELVLVNTDPGEAVVDISVLGPSGELDEATVQRGLTVAAGERVSVDLVELAPQGEDLAVHVEASRGRVAAGLADSFAGRPGASAGAEWIPSQARVSRFLRLAPLTSRADRRTLVVANPSGREALVTVEVAGAGGSFEPVENAELRVPPGATVSSDVSAGVGEDASAVTLRSTTRIAASIRSTLGADTSYAAAVPVIPDAAAALLVDARRAAVHLTAGDLGGAVEVTAFTAAGDEVARQEVDLAEGATAAWKPPARAAYVVVRRTSGVVFGGVALTAPDGISQVPLRPLPVRRRAAVVEPALR